MKPENTLEFENTQVHFHTLDGIVRAVNGVSFEVAQGETVGVVGESGCGKSVTAYSSMRLLPKKIAKIAGGHIWFRRRNGEVVDITTLDPEGSAIRDIRGNEIAMIFQEPMTSLSPMHTIGDQITEAIMLHQDLDEQQAEESAIAMLEAVSIGNAREFIKQYPHQYSGGMRQRAMIAMALSCNPTMLIADEPTTALDVTIQAQILDLMRNLQQEFDSAILMITHNLGVINEMADRIVVMYMGRVVEIAERTTLFKRPCHPYTVGLMQSVPEMGNHAKTRLSPIPGMIPDPYNLPPGCAFATRCPARNDRCVEPREVPMTEIEPGHWVRCYLYGDES